MSGFPRKPASSVPFPRSVYGGIYSSADINNWRRQTYNTQRIAENSTFSNIQNRSTNVTAATNTCMQPLMKTTTIKISKETSQSSTTYMRLARHYNIERSLFERLILNDVYSRQLGVVHSTNHTYPPLGDASVELIAVRGIVDNLYVFKNQYAMNEDDSWSHTAQMTLQLANYLIQQDYKPDDVLILTAYAGQLIYMKNQRTLFANITNVKMAVLEDYSGEESKIILISMPIIKTNSTEEIRFLAMEKKLIVAISKAKEGFYMFGDMELLKDKSPLWSHVETMLIKKGSIGQGLKLKCANHGFQITTVENVTDFSKVPEGGCLRDCKYQLSCGHICPRICHAYDITHANFKCTKPCERKICEFKDHKCPLPCSTECQPCQRLVMKVLRCGHRKEVPCHYEVGDPRIYCDLVVDITLPDCGHKARKACSMKLEDVKCGEKCVNSRLDCGHSCVRTCHVKDDPDHENYICEKLCSRAKRGCTAHLEGDLRDHQCPKLCYQECPDCDVQVIKLSLKSSECRHPRRVPCHIKADEVPCKENCERFLPCGHRCSKQCWQPCGDCQIMVKKTIPGCQHEIEVACGVKQTPAQCKSQCSRTLDCGHECPGRCNEPCNTQSCKKIMDRNFDSPCGHKVKLPCHAMSAILTGGLKPELLPQHCVAPCGAVLRCGHACPGTCASCRRGRLHAPCAVPCDRVNVCGHRCKESCHVECPPCMERCQVKCQHSTCSEPCGAPCTPCTEPDCCRACEHSQCSVACGAVCDAAPCARACRKLQACGHRCRGVCGEPCPAACRICDPIHFPVELTGHPYDDDVKLIQLQDCQHILDVDTLDGYMNSQLENIQIRGCPICREPIISTYRYKDIINRMIKNDINTIKERVYGTLSQRQEKKRKVSEKVVFLNRRVNQKLALAHTKWRPAIKLIEIALEDKTTSLHHLRMCDTHFDLLKDVGEHYMKYNEAKLETLKKEKEELVDLICEVLVTNRILSQQQLEDITIELKRLKYLINLAVMLEHPNVRSTNTKPKVTEAAANAKEAVLNWFVFDELKAAKCLQVLQDAVNVSGIGTQGKWYRCKSCRSISCYSYQPGQPGLCKECTLRSPRR